MKLDFSLVVERPDKTSRCHFEYIDIYKHVCVYILHVYQYNIYIIDNIYIYTIRLGESRANTGKRGWGRREKQTKEE